MSSCGISLAGAKLTDDIRHSMRLAELWALGHLPLAELVETIRELQTTFVEIVVAPPGEGSEKRLTTITGSMLEPRQPLAHEPEHPADQLGLRRSKGTRFGRQGLTVTR